jgi:hypothetical protein
MWSFSTQTEPLIRAIQRSTLLDAIGRRLALAFSRIVRPGKFKDLFSGTWLGHPVHPLLTDAPIGAWTSGVTLDLLGGRGEPEGSGPRVGCDVDAAGNKTVALHRREGSIVPDDLGDRIGRRHEASSSAIVLQVVSSRARRS